MILMILVLGEPQGFSSEYKSCQQILGTQQVQARKVYPRTLPLKEVPAFIEMTKDKKPVPSALLRVVDLKKKAIVVDFYDLTLNHHQLPPLADGIYIYLISRTGKIALLNRAAKSFDDFLEETEDYIGTHQGLHLLLDPEQIMAAGEISMRGNTVFMFSNRSGSFRGSSRHLKFAQLLFTEIGLPLTDKTHYLDFSVGSVPHPHASLKRQVQSEILISADSEAQKNLLQLRSAIEPFYFAKQDAIRKCIRAAMTMDGLGIRELSPAGFLISQWKSPVESEPDVLYRYLGSEDHLPINRVIEIINALAKYL